MRVRQELVAASLLVTASIAACTSFSSDPEPAADAGGPDSSSEAIAQAEGGMGLEASSDVSTTDAGCMSAQPFPLPLDRFMCGSASCSGVDEWCCDPLGPVPSCLKAGGSCQATQLNCGGPTDCIDEQVCCQANAGAGTQCRKPLECQLKRACKTNADCLTNEKCVPPANTTTQPWWSCEPC